MADINRVVVTGRLTREPDLRTTASGSTVLSFGIANNERRRNQQTSQWEDYTNFFECTMFGNRSEPLSRILTKGTLVCVEGKLRWSSWERDGQKRSKVEIIVDEVVLPGRSGGAQGSSDAGQTGASYSGQPTSSYAAPAPQPPMDQVYDEEIPF